MKEHDPIDELAPGVMKSGDIVVITKAETEFFKVGDKAKLLYQDDDGDWWADFTLNSEYEDDGEWCLEKGISEYKLIQEE